jgi:hypothetical protein
MKLSTIKDIVIILAIAYIFYSQGKSNTTPATTTETIVYHDTITNNIVTTPHIAPTVVKYITRIDTIHGGDRIVEVHRIDTLHYFDTILVDPGYNVYTDTVQMDGATIKASHIAKDFKKSYYDIDIIRDSVVTVQTITKLASPLRLYGTTHIGTTGYGIGVHLGLKNITGGYWYNMKDRSNNVMLGYRIF